MYGGSEDVVGTHVYGLVHAHHPRNTHRQNIAPFEGCYSLKVCTDVLWTTMQL